MKTLIAAGLGVVGLWFAVPSLLTVVASAAGPAANMPTPLPVTSAVLGLLMLVVSAALWRPAAKPAAAQRNEAAGDNAPRS